jgi:hypothetical protein
MDNLENASNAYLKFLDEEKSQKLAKFKELIKSIKIENNTFRGYYDNNSILDRKTIPFVAIAFGVDRIGISYVCGVGEIYHLNA